VKSRTRSGHVQNKIRPRSVQSQVEGKPKIDKGQDHVKVWSSLGQAQDIVWSMSKSSHGYVKVKVSSR